jgi:hypothetical protein
VAAAISVRSSTGSVVNKLTFAHVQMTGLSANAADGTEKRYYVRCTLSGQDPLRSHVFGPSSDGKHEWDNVLFPAAGTWTMTVRDVSNDSVVATHSQVVA